MEFRKVSGMVFAALFMVIIYNFVISYPDVFASADSYTIMPVRNCVINDISIFLFCILSTDCYSTIL